MPAPQIWFVVVFMLSIVVYEALLAGAVLDPAKPIEGYW
jgi:hypothetical protein